MRIMVISISIITLVCVSASAGPESWDELRRLKSGQVIVVTDVKLRRLSGKFVGATDEGISLRGKKAVVTLPKSEVARVSLRRPRSRRAFRGMLIGLGIGGGLTPVGWKAGEENGSAALALLPVGLALGAGIGAALPPGYQTVYQVESPTMVMPREDNSE